MTTDLYQHEHELAHQGYKNLGWQNSWSGIHDMEWLKEQKPEYLECVLAEHPLKNMTVSTSKHIVCCDACKIYWFYDSSD